MFFAPRVTRVVLIFDVWETLISPSCPHGGENYCLITNSLGWKWSYTTTIGDTDLWTFRISVPLWRGALKTANAFKIELRICCGHGTSVKFWKDCWIGEVPLAIAFPNLFEMAVDQDAWVSSQFQDNDRAVSFRHPLSPAMLQMLASLIGILRGHTVRNYPDRVIWKARAVDNFTVRSQYELLQPLRPQDKAAKYIWKALAPLKVKITTWLAVRDRLPTGLYLQRRYITLPTHCVFCDNHLESSSHFFFIMPICCECLGPYCVRIGSSLLAHYPSENVGGLANLE